MNLSSNLTRNSNNETNFSHKLLSTGTQVSKIRKVFANRLSANIKLSKTQLSKIQSGGFSFSVLNNINKIEEQIMKRIKGDGTTLTNN